MSGSDKSLLDRLSALKGGSPGVSLDRSSNALDVSLAGIEPAKPPSREDALAARLRSLRNTPEREDPAPSPQIAKVTARSPPLGQQTSHRGETASLSPASPLRLSHPGAPPQPQPPLRSSKSSASAPTPAGAGAADDVDPLLQTDDQTLEDLLSDEDIREGSAPQRWHVDPGMESAKVNALLEELSKAPSYKGAERDQWPRDGCHDDDSDGEEMTRDVGDLLSQAVDEARLNPQPEEVSDPPQPDNSHYKDQRASREDHQGDSDGRLSLPSVPSTMAAPKADNDDDGGLPGLSLPSVPSGAPKLGAASDFDDDIAARMAALSGLGSSSDGMGLPSVPTFQPADRSVKRLTSKAGYTDEDADSWCTVCLEDATLRCLGCEDVYCVRCWREMHIGSAAAFDDRTHKAVQFVRPTKDQQRRVAMGAT